MCVCVYINLQWFQNFQFNHDFNIGGAIGKLTQLVTGYQHMLSYYNSVIY